MKANKKVNIITLGCAKNLVDSERIKSYTEQSGLSYTDDVDSADYLIINTCGFIDSAKKENIDVIMQAAGLKEIGSLEKLIVAGCLSQRYKKELKSQIPQVDAFFGVNQFKNIVRTLIPKKGKKLKTDRSLMTPSHYAYLKIAEGCSHKCSFCAIPHIKGKYKSRPEEEMLNEARELMRKGVKEIIIIAQDTTYYGMDLYGKRRLPELAEKISKVCKPERLRIMYAYPVNFPWKLIDVMKDNENICNYLDIPLQHVSERILKSMKRNANKSELTEFIDKLRERIPGIALRSTFITGYPGETDKEHNELCGFLRQMQLDRVGVFPYSHEENTSAYSLEDDISRPEKEKRLEELMIIQQEISLKKNRALIGSTKRVLIDFEEDGYFICRSCSEAPDIDISISAPAHNNFKPGDFALIRITEARPYDLFGEIVF